MAHERQIGSDLKCFVSVHISGFEIDITSINRESWNEPSRVRGLDNVKARGASASGVVSGAIGEDGSLWVWGKSKRGQLGLGKGVIEALLPSRVEVLAKEKIIQVGYPFSR